MLGMGQCVGAACVALIPKLVGTSGGSVALEEWEALGGVSGIERRLPKKAARGGRLYGVAVDDLDKSHAWPQSD